MYSCKGMENIKAFHYAYVTSCSLATLMRNSVGIDTEEKQINLNIEEDDEIDDLIEFLALMKELTEVMPNFK